MEGIEQSPREDRFILAEHGTEEAVIYFSGIAPLEQDLEREKEGERKIDDFEQQHARLYEEEQPKAVELEVALGESDDPNCRLSAAMGLDHLIGTDPEKGLRLAMKLLADPDERVASAADHHMTTNKNFENFQPVIDARTVRSLLFLARDLVERERAHHRDS
ncbi:hypothetical protein [Actinomadura formosensis]|uniref:hypothetical protein n=1 Tax=Actinomadura formosensis TaxID=60706 RepID=UPI0010417727|nr:hypothetical protein [Actinomadura formosensis]